jgi:hypothetical protein
MLKLPPAYPAEDIPRKSDVVYLGSESDCRECLALSGVFENETAHAVAVGKNETLKWQCKKSELQRIDLEAKNLGSFILEPNPVLIRSHLFLSEAKKHGFWQIDSSLAYLSCENLPPVYNGFSAFKVVEQSSLSTNSVKAMLKKYDVAKITLKKRGVSVIPEAEIRRLAPKGENEKQFILFYARILGEKRAILAEPYTAVFAGK